MSTINAIGVPLGNLDEIVFVLTKVDVSRVYNTMNSLNLGTPLPETVWSAFKENKYRLEARLDHAEAIEDVLHDYCRQPAVTLTASIVDAPPPPAVNVYEPWQKRQRERFNTAKFRPQGYGHHVVWSAHRARSFMLALKQKPTVYDENIRTLAKIAGVHPYDFYWKTNPVSFGKKHGLTDWDMKLMMGKGYEEMRQRFSQNGVY